MTLISSYRDICLADLNGEDFGAFLRTSLLVAVFELGGSSQFGGGLNGGTTDICHLLMSQLFCYARVKRTSASILFVDVVGAFASTARRICVPNLPESEESWKRHLNSCGFSPAQASDIVSTALTILKWTAAGASEHSAAILQEMMSTTWFSIDVIKGINRCIQGTLAGTSLADVCLRASLKTSPTA